MRIWHTDTVLSGQQSASYEVGRRTLIKRDLLPRDGAVGNPLLRELGVWAGNRGNGCATDLHGREARC